MIKNILNYTKNLICFAVSSLLLLSISYADLVVNQNYSIRTYAPISDPGYQTYYDALVSYKNNPSSSNTIVQTTIIDSQINQGNHVVFYKDVNGDYNVVYDYDYNSDTGNIVVLDDGVNKCIGVIFTPVPGSNTRKGSLYTSKQDNCYVVMNGPAGALAYYDAFPLDTLIFTTNQLPLLTKNGNNATWDGSYYSITPPTPSYIPTNEEIAEKVQAFYDSDLFQNQNDFKDYFVLYNYNNETFSFIGHNLVGTITDSNGSHDNMSLLGQVIYSADYPTNTVGQDYWSFRFETDWSKIVNFFNGNKYYLFSTTLDSETIIYNGMGSISDLVQLKFDPTYSTIVYSTKDYMVTIFDNPSPPDPDFGTRDIMPGDLYTYDENIDPTTSEYNPITNYVLPNSVDTLISNADIPGLLQIWVTPDFSNMGWVFLAISSFWGYFGGFVLLTAVMFFIMWLLRG